MKLKHHFQYLFALVIFNSASSFGQTIEQPKEPSKIETGFEGMIGLSAGEDLVALNVGGPSLKYKLSKDYKIGIGAFPSLILMDEKVYPKLAFSPIIEHNHWLFITPYYGYDAHDKMLWTFGFGYKF